ncbi:S8 family serine peptidase [Desulfitobacterium metallireducens]|uniref:Peptidase n=1 Tax=Desulfitobacterium metallireducens DSM 15288 TaxID=871968 RepID=W0EBE3_9FIRM|nr:cell wall-binding repeat-containing protein [Desulfitobacterium metallireducens]AHF08087.1 peptidase [Desulfitobacterium metallireducens DSM 15288]
MFKMLNKGLGLGLSLILLFGSVPGSTAAQVSLQTSDSEKTLVNPSLLDAEGQIQGPEGRLIVKLSPGTSPEAIAQSVQAELARKGPLQYITLALEPSRIEEVMTKLKAIPDVLSVSPSQQMKISSSVASTAVTDPYYSQQWGLTQAQVPKAWDLGATGDGIIVAIIDTGVDVGHPDLQGNLVPGYNAITGQTGLTATQDNNGHGTHVAGIVGAERDGSGIIGVAYQSKIMPIKAMDRHGEGSDDVIADGIVWAANHGAKIINLSIGTDTQAEILYEAIQYANDQGCLIIAAGGNKDEQSNFKTITFPAADPQVLAVTATDKADQLASFSLTGPNASLAAPGTDILSDYWQDGSGYATSDGTSMASPFVAGVAALVWSQHPDFSASQVRQDLEDSALDLGPVGRDSSFGYGRVDAYWAVKFAAEKAILSAPAQVSWAGGIVQGDPTQTSAQVEIPSRAFGTDQKQTIQLSMNTTTGAVSLPAGVNPVGEPLELAWEASPPVQKYLQLSLSTDPESFAPDSNRFLYIYHWSGTRWLKVGGGMNSGTVTVGITEPGIYQLGSALLPQVTRLAGADRIETALQISQVGFPDGADTVLLARAEDFPDALAGAPLAYKKHAPILLTNSTTLPESVLTEIQRLNPQQILLLGGTGAVSAEIETELQSQYSVRRLGGANRYATAQQIANELGMTGEAVVVNGDNFPDAISMSSIAAQYGVPILLTAVNDLPQETDQLLRQLAVTGTVVVGGKGVISTHTFELLPNSFRLAGQDRYATAAQVLKAFPPQGGMTFLATGENFPDALTGGVFAALNSTNLVLVSPTGLNGGEQNVLQGWSGKKVFAFGGKGVVSDSLLDQIQRMLQ